MSIQVRVCKSSAHVDKMVGTCKAATFVGNLLSKGRRMSTEFGDVVSSNINENWNSLRVGTCGPNRKIE